MKRYEVRVEVTMVMEAASEGQATEIAMGHTRAHGAVGEPFNVKFHDRWVSKVREMRPTETAPKSE